MKIMATAVLAIASVLSADVARADSFNLAGAFSTRGVFSCAGGLGATCSGTGTDTLVLGSA
jgi:hypothetical protein